MIRNALLSLTTPLFSQAWASPPLIIELGEHHTHTLKVIAHIADRGPVHLENIESLIRHNCAAGMRHEVCGFSQTLRAHAQAYADWTSLHKMSDPFGFSPVILRPRWNLDDVRGGLWNVDPQRGGELAKVSARLATRLWVTHLAVRRDFEAVAAWFGQWGNPSGTFPSTIRPQVAAFLSSYSAAAQTTQFLANMNCGSGQIACLAIKRRVLTTLGADAAAFVALRASLEQGAFGPAEVQAAYAANKALLDATTRLGPGLLTALNKGEELSIPEIKAYHDYLEQRALRRKSLTHGPYSMADEIHAVLALLDLQSLQMPVVPATTPTVTFGPESEKAFVEFEQAMRRQFAVHRAALERLVTTVSAPPGS